MNLQLRSPYFGGVDVLRVAPVVMDRIYRRGPRYDLQRVSAFGPKPGTLFAIQRASGDEPGFTWPSNYHWMTIQ